MEQRQQAPVSKSPQDRLKELIVRIGDGSLSNIKDQINKLVNEVMEFFVKNNTEAKEAIIKHFSECIGLLTQKGGIYATVVTILETKIPTFAEKIIDKVLEQLQNNLDNGDLIVPKYSLIFLGELMNIGLINSFSYVTMLYDLTSEAEKTLTQSYDYYLFLVVSIIPYTIDGLSEKSGIEFKDLIESIENLMKKRSSEYLKVARLLKNKDGEDKLSFLWRNLKEQIMKKSMPLKVLIKPYLEFQEEFKSIKQNSEILRNKKIYFNNKKANFCTHQISEHLNLLEEESGKSDTQSPLNSYLIQDHLCDFLRLYQHSKKILLQKILNYNCVYEFTGILVETLFSEMLRLPASECKLIYYSVIIITLSFESNEKFKNSFVKNVFDYITILFQKLEYVNIESQERIIDFLSHYLSNNHLNWDWEKWVTILEEEEGTNTRQLFLNHLLCRVAYLVPQKLIKEEIPTSLHSLLPLENLIHESTNSNPDVEMLMSQFDKKCSDEHMVNILKNPEKFNYESKGDQLIDIFMECFLMKTHKSIAHLRIIIDRYYKNTLSDFIFNNKEVNQYKLLDSIYLFWKQSTWHIEVYIERFIQHNLVKPNVIIQWVFKCIDKDLEEKNNFQLFWNILFNLVNKVLGKSYTIKKEFRKLDKEKEKNSSETAKATPKITEFMEAERIMFQNIFKKLGLAIHESFSVSKYKYEILMERLIQFGAKYRKEFDGILDKIEEDFQQYESILPLKNAISLIKSVA